MVDAAARLGVKLAAAGVGEVAATRLLRAVDVEADATDEELDAEIDDLRGVFPALFVDVEAGPTPRPPTQRAPRARLAPGAALRRGAELAAQRHPAQVGMGGDG